MSATTTSSIQININVINKKTDSCKEDHHKKSEENNSKIEGTGNLDMIAKAINHSPTRNYLGFQDEFESIQREAENKNQTKTIELNFERQARLIKAKVSLVDFFINSIKDGELTDEEKKTVLKLIEEYKSLKNFLKVNQKIQPTKIGDVVFGYPQVNAINDFQIDFKRVFDIVFHKLENKILEEENLAASDNKISTAEREENFEAKSELDEIKTLGKMVLEALQPSIIFSN